MRILAALHVVMFHLGKDLIRSASDSACQWAIGISPPFAMVVGALCRLSVNFISSGYVGVSFFFVLSGFILAYNYMDCPTGMTVGARSFWIARFARIYPMYFLGWLLAATGACSLLSLKHGVLHIVGDGLVSLALLQSWTPMATLWNGPAWSLSVEAFFYFMFPFIARFHFVPASATRVRRALWLRFILYTYLFAVFIPVTFILLTHYHRGLFPSEQRLDVVHLVIYLPAFRIPEFLIGVWMGRMFLGDLRWSRKPAAWLLGFSIPATFLAICAMPVIPFALARMGLIAPLFGLLIYAAAHGGRIADLLSMKWVVLLGEASYAVYILHQPVAWWIRRLVPQLFAPIGDHLLWPVVDGWVGLGVLFATIVGISVACFVLIEVPSRGFLRTAIESFFSRAGHRLPR